MRPTFDRVMRRDYFTLDVSDVDWVESDDDPRHPSVVIDFRGPAEDLRRRLETPDGDLLDADQTDTAYRLKGEPTNPTAGGVVSVTNRITGDFVLELNEDAIDVLTFIKAARRYGERENDDGQYHVEIRIDDDLVTTYEKSTFLVYNDDGDLLRHHSLIPSGVEL